MARPTKLTPERKERILQSIRAGNYVEPSCRAAGISSSTLYRWLERGEREPAGVYHEFADAVRRAEAEAEVYAVATIRRAMPNDWRAAVAYLERRYPGRWRRHTSTELTGRDGGPIQTELAMQPDLTRLSDDELALIEKLIARATDQA